MMKHANFHTRFTGATLLLGGVMVALGFLIRPVAIAQNFQIANFLDINNAMTILMIYPDNTKAYLPINLAITLWYMVLGITVFSGVNETTES